MPIATKTFRLFISSTFEDLKEERDALQRNVFPKLRELCQSHGARFQAIDLRWGVRDEAALDHQTMDICLREIERCQKTGIKPSFVALLGERYGWRPTPARIPAAEFEKVFAQIENSRDSALVADWYQCDRNAVPPEYLLRPRTGGFTDPQRWAETERDLHEILCAAATGAGLSGEALAQYEASATHQEIMKALPPCGVPSGNAFAFIRESASNAPPDPGVVELSALLEERLGRESVRRFAFGSFDRLCADIETLLSRSIRREIEAFESRPALDSEIEAHEQFAADTSAHFTGRMGLLVTVRDHIQGGSRSPLVLEGPPGSGKSALMAHLSMPSPANRHSGTVVIRRFCGATPDSISGMALLRSVCEQMSWAYGVAEETPSEFQPLTLAFRDRLKRVSAEHPLELYFDGLDQLGDDDIGSFQWLNQPLPEHVTVICSAGRVPPGLQQAVRIPVGEMPATDGERLLDVWLADARRALQPKQRDLLRTCFRTPFLPLHLRLAFEEARRWKSFDPSEAWLLAKDADGMIDLLFERLSAPSAHGPLIVSRSLACLAASRYGLTEDEILDVLSADEEVWNDFTARAHHVPPERRLPIAIWSRLSLDLEPYLAERTSPGGTVLNFFHAQVARRAAQRWLDGQRVSRHAQLAGYFGRQPDWLDAAAVQPNLRRLAELLRHQIGAGDFSAVETVLSSLEYVSAKCVGGLAGDLLADYDLASGALPELRDATRHEVARKREMACWTDAIVNFAARWSERRDTMAKGETVTDPEPIPPVPPKSVELRSDEEIGAEALRALRSPRQGDLTRMFRRFVFQEAGVLREFGSRPGLVVQQAHNFELEGPVHDAACRMLAGTKAPTLLRMWPPGASGKSSNSVLQRLVGHTAEITAVAATPDGRRAISSGDDSTILVWDLSTGERLRKFEGHTSAIPGLAITPDGRWAVSGSDDETVRLWDLEAGLCIRILEGHGQPVWCVALTPDARRAISGSADGKFRLWDLKEGSCLRILSGHTSKAWSVAISADGRTAVSGAWDGTARIWDLETGGCRKVLEAHDQDAEGPDNRYRNPLADVHTFLGSLTAQAISPAVLVAISADGRHAVSSDSLRSDAKQYPTLMVWDLDTGSLVRAIAVERDGQINGLSIAPDGKRAACAIGPASIYDPCSKYRLWDLSSGKCLRTLRGPAQPTWCVGLTDAGGTLICPDDGHALAVWNMRDDSGARIAWRPESGIEKLSNDHLGRVTDLRQSDDGGRLFSSASEDRWRMWDFESGACTSTQRKPAALSLLRRPDENQKRIESKDGTRVLLDLGKDTLRVEDVRGQGNVRVLKGHIGHVTAACLNADGKLAASGGVDGALRHWDVEAGSSAAVVPPHGRPVTCVDLSPDGRLAVSGADDGSVRIWQPSGGIGCTIVGRLHTPPCSILLGANSRRLATGHFTGEVAVFRIRSLESQEPVLDDLALARDRAAEHLECEIAVSRSSRGPLDPRTLMLQLHRADEFRRRESLTAAIQAWTDLAALWCDLSGKEADAARRVVAGLPLRLARHGMFVLAQSTQDKSSFKRGTEYLDWGASAKDKASVVELERRREAQSAGGWEAGQRPTSEKWPSDPASVFLGAALLVGSGDPDQALSKLHRRADRARITGDLSELCTTLGMLAAIALEKEDLALAIAASTELEGLYRETSADLGMLAALQIEATALAYCEDRDDEAFKALDKLEALARGTGNAASLAVLLRVRASMHMGPENWPEAVTDLVELELLYERYGNWPGMVGALTNQGQILWSCSGNRREAISTLDRARKLAEIWEVSDSLAGIQQMRDSWQSIVSLEDRRDEETLR